MPANVSAKLPAVATDRRGRAALRDARRRQDSAIRYLRDKATTKTAVLEREVLPQAQAPHALREHQGQGLRASSANKALVNQCMKRVRWSVDGGRNVLAFGAMSGRFDAARRPERASRTTALNAARRRNSANKT